MASNYMQTFDSSLYIVEVIGLAVAVAILVLNWKAYMH